MPTNFMHCKFVLVFIVYRNCSLEHSLKHLLFFIFVRIGQRKILLYMKLIELIRKTSS